MEGLCTLRVHFSAGLKVKVKFCGLLTRKEFLKGKIVLEIKKYSGSKQTPNLIRQMVKGVMGSAPLARGKEMGEQCKGMQLSVNARGGRGAVWVLHAKLALGKRGWQVF